jgi:hypothetical protein
MDAIIRWPKLDGKWMGACIQQYGTPDNVRFYIQFSVKEMLICVQMRSCLSRPRFLAGDFQIRRDLLDRDGLFQDRIDIEPDDLFERVAVTPT